MAPVGLQSQCQTPGMECKGLFIWSLMVLVHLSLSSNQGPSGHSQSVWRCFFFFFSDKPLFSQLKNTYPCSSLPLVSPVSRDLFIITQLIHHLFAEVFLTRSFFSYIDQVFFLFPLYSQLFHDLPFVSVGWGFMRQSRGCTCLVCHCISGVWHRAWYIISSLYTLVEWISKEQTLIANMRCCLN